MRQDLVFIAKFLEPGQHLECGPVPETATEWPRYADVVGRELADAGFGDAEMNALRDGCMALLRSGVTPAKASNEAPDPEGNPSARGAAS